MLSKIPVWLDERHAQALSRLARNEYRDIRQQAAVLIRDELARRGLLCIDEFEPETDEQPQERAMQPTSS